MPPPAIDIADRDYVEAQRGAGAGFFVGALVDARFTDRQVFTESRPRLGTGGQRIGGVIFGTFRHEIFADFHSKVAERGGDTVILGRDDGAVLARHPQQPAAFEAALLNLALSARYAMPRGGCIRLRVTAGWPAPAAGGPPQRHATIAVIDAGIGMDAATLARVAELLFTTKPPGLGTGLGLALVQGFALASGGTMRLQGAGPGAGRQRDAAAAGGTRLIGLHAGRPGGRTRPRLARPFAGVFPR